jgi:hypothetical protein
MTEPNQAVVPEPAGAEAAYRPISGLAVAGFSLACLYTGVVAISTLTALIVGGAYFLSDFFFLLALVAAVLCFLAQRHIRASEGTRAGLPLARWGLWLSVFTGLGYLSYSQFTKKAIEQQANAFLMEASADGGFFPLLIGGSPAEINAAFLLTRTESDRGNVDPKDVRRMTQLFDTPGPKGPAPLTAFRSHLFVQVFQRGGKDCKVEAQAVHSWGYEKVGYQVTRFYRISTPESIIKVRVPVKSTEGDIGGMRKWFVDFNQVGIVELQYTPLGLSLKHIQDLAHSFLQDKLNDLRQGKLSEPFPDKTDWERITQGQPLGLEMRDRIRGILKGETMAFIPSLEAEKYLTPWRLDKGKPQFDFFVELKFVGPKEMPLSANCQITVACKESVIPQGKDQPDLGSFPPQPHWEIVSFALQRIGLGAR